MNRAVWLIGPAWAIGISAYIMFAPLIRGVRVSASRARGHSIVETSPQFSQSSWYETLGPRAARPLVIPTVLTFLPVVAPKSRSRRILRALSVAALGAFCVLSGFSIGPYYVPSVVAFVAAFVFEHVVGKKEGRLTQ